MILPTLKVKVNFKKDEELENFEKQIEKYLKNKITPALREELRKILFTSAPASRSWFWKEFKDNYAGLFPAGLMNEFDKKRAVDAKGSIVSYKERTGELDIQTKIKDDIAKDFEKDPVGYIVKSVAGLDSGRVSEIWKKALEKSKEETQK